MVIVFIVPTLKFTIYLLVGSFLTIFLSSWWRKLQLQHFCIHIDVTFIPAYREKERQHLCSCGSICLMGKLNRILQPHLGQPASTAVPPCLNKWTKQYLYIYSWIYLLWHLLQWHRSFRNIRRGSVKQTFTCLVIQYVEEFSVVLLNVRKADLISVIVKQISGHSIAKYMSFFEYWWCSGW